MHEIVRSRGEADITPEDVFQFLSYAGNDERKLLIILALKSANQPLGRADLYKTLSTLAGEKLEGSSRGIQGVVERNLVRLGVVDVQRIEIEDNRFGSQHTALVNGYSLTHKGEEIGVAFAGQLLQWSLDHPQASLAQIFGTPNNKGDEQAAYLRYAILRQLAGYADDRMGTAIIHLAAESDISYRAKLEAARRLVQYGILSREDVPEDYRVQFKIIDPQYITEPSRRSFERLQPETQLLFNAFKTASEIKEIWGFEEFFEITKKLFPLASEADFKKARDRLKRALTSSDQFFRQNIVNVSPEIFDAGKRYYLAEDSRNAVIKLLSIIEDFQYLNPEALNQGNIYAEEVMRSEQKFKDLYYKARRISNHANQDSKLDERNLTLVKNLGQKATLQAIHNEYIRETGREVTLPVTEESLDRLIQREKLQVRMLPQSEQNKRSVRHYSLVDKDQA